MRIIIKFKWEIITLIFFILGVFSSLIFIKIQSKEFSSCESFPLNINDKIDGKIQNLMKNKKYQEAISLGNKHLKDNYLWYCDTNFWSQRARSFYELGNCVQSQIAALHAIYVSPIEANGQEIEFYNFVKKSDICVTKY